MIDVLFSVKARSRSSFLKKIPSNQANTGLTPRSDDKKETRSWLLTSKGEI
ncbi:MAG: hypothetical protein ACRCT1_11995 [Microcoleaceae cyanobacterium]